MKLWKKAAIGIILLILMFAFWHIAMSRESTELVAVSMAVSQGLSGLADKEILSWNLSEPEAKEDKSHLEEHIESSSEIEPVLNLTDIQQMEAGSILDISRIEEGLTESLFYSEKPGDELQQRIMGISYQGNDNISIEELRYLRVLYMGFDGQSHIGELLVNQSIADDVLEIMAKLYENEYAIEKMVLVDAYGADDEQSMEDNNTSAFNYREVAGTSRMSRHSLGLAIDINPKYNPYVKGSGETAVISPANAAEYADRSREFAHKIDENDLCYQLFIEHGFTWGGSWNSVKDYQHFEK